VGKHPRITAALIALVALTLPALAGCKGKSQITPPPAPAASAAASAAVPPPDLPDQLLPGEIAPGPDNAFGLAVPRRMRLLARFPDAVFAEGELPVEDVASYVEKRVAAESVEKGPAKTVFLRAAVKDAPGRALRVEVIARGLTTALVVRDLTRPPAKGGLTEEQRWNELGLTPQGQLLDPTTLE
jgi:hypothetical protein